MPQEIHWFIQGHVAELGCFFSPLSMPSIWSIWPLKEACQACPQSHLQDTVATYHREWIPWPRVAGWRNSHGFVYHLGEFGIFYLFLISWSLLTQNPPTGGGKSFIWENIPGGFDVSRSSRLRMISAGPWSQRGHAGWIGPSFGLAEGPAEFSCHLKL